MFAQLTFPPVVPSGQSASFFFTSCTVQLVAFPFQQNRLGDYQCDLHTLCLSLAPDFLSALGATRLWYVWLSHLDLPPPPPAPPSVPRRQICPSRSALGVLEVGESAEKQRQEGG